MQNMFNILLKSVLLPVEIPDRNANKEFVNNLGNANVGGK